MVSCGLAIPAVPNPQQAYRGLYLDGAGYIESFQPKYIVTSSKGAKTIKPSENQVQGRLDDHIATSLSRMTDH
jgi:hypothetical protein